MNLEEARKVLWLRNNQKTLGELFDEGYLNQSRLEWAAQKAFRQDLKEAAGVILASRRTVEPEKEKLAIVPSQPQVEPMDAGISLEKARTTMWPFSPFKGQPMGALVDSGQLSLKDLGYAIENAWDDKVRRSSMALMLSRLDQTIKEPSPSAGFTKLISGGRSYSERQETRWTLLQGFIFGVIMTALIAFLLNTSNVQASNKQNTLKELVSTPAGVTALIIGIVGCILIYWLTNSFMEFLTKRLDKKIEEYRLGKEGEDRVSQVILQALDGNWHLIRNLTLPGSNKGDLDLVLVGPPGVWVLEVKNFRGEYKNVGDTWEYLHGKNWKPASGNPSRQALKNAVRLGNFLKADHINTFVTPVVVWANQANHLQVENPSVAVWSLNHLADELGNVWHGEKLSDTERNTIIEKLSKLCERQS